MPSILTSKGSSQNQRKSAMIRLDTRQIVTRLKTLESVALISRVASTNLIARRVLHECIENELLLPKAIIIAGEQFAGRGRNQRSWSSPAGKGIYATTLITRPLSELPVVPLAIANILATFVRDAFGVDARIKWPNDILVGGKKLAGILIEARVQEDRALLLIGTGINVEPVQNDDRTNAVSLSEVSPRDIGGLDAVTDAFISAMDQGLSQPFEASSVLEQWRSLAVHRVGDSITCVIGDRTIHGTWNGIDDQGRAIVQDGNESTAVSAGDLILT